MNKNFDALDGFLKSTEKNTAKFLTFSTHSYQTRALCVIACHGSERTKIRHKMSDRRMYGTMCHIPDQQSPIPPVYFYPATIDPCIVLIICLRRQSGASRQQALNFKVSSVRPPKLMLQQYHEIFFLRPPHLSHGSATVPSHYFPPVPSSMLHPRSTARPLHARSTSLPSSLQS